MESVSSETAGGVGVYLGLAFILMAIVFLSGCDARSEASQQMPAPDVDVALVQPEPVTLWESFTGRVVAPETVELRPRVSGYIDKVTFEEGALVNAGDLLFQIDPRPYQARKQAAQAQLAQARSELALANSQAERARSLMESRAISREEYDQRNAAKMSARALVNAAKAALETAELDLQYTRVTAPVSGRAGRALVTRGNLASADQTLLTTLVSVDPMYVYFDADEQAAQESEQARVAGKPTRVRIGLAGESGFPHQGTLNFIDNRLNANTGTLQYRAELANPNGTFKPGQFARVQLPMARMDNAMLVNRKAVLTDQDRRFVYVVGDDNMAARRQVTPGRAVDDQLVILDGLQRGDRVIINGVQKVFFDGMPVAPNQVAMGDRPDSATVVVAQP